jgi:decaprenylphospho-beta-D-ribofuranose 2-oxidase
MRRATATVYRPESVSQLADLLRAIPAGRRATFRAGGQSFDGQSLNDDLVIMLDAESFSTIGDPYWDDDEGFRITVGAGARWWKIVDKVAPLGLFPPSIVTSGKATVGGTLSADCLSRMSSVTGKEGERIRSFRIVLTDGQILDCKKDDPDPKKRAIFMATIGGFGYLGAVVEVTFDLMAIRSRPGMPGKTPVVFTRSTRRSTNVDWDTLLRALQGKSRVSRASYQEKRAHSKGALVSASEWPALSIASFVLGNATGANLLEQGFIENRELRPTPGGIYDRTSAVTAKAEFIVGLWPTLAELGVEMGFPEGEFIDELFGWTFFMGNTTSRAKEIARSSGQRLNFSQQSFVLPAGHRDHAPDTRPVRRFIEQIEGRLHRADIRPANIDFLYIPGDRFLMSASRDLPGFVATVAFANVNCEKLDSEICDLLCELSRDCRVLGGRVHLVKNVVADPSDLRAMHGDAAAELRELKFQVEPKGILRNEFFDRVFDA